MRSRSMKSRSIANAVFSNATSFGTSSTVAVRITSPGQFPVLDTVGLIGGRAKASLPIGLVILVVPLEPHDLAVAFEGEHVRGDAVEEPAIVADDHGTAGEIEERLLE